MNAGEHQGDKVLRRLAVQIVAQLPDKREDALTVLKHAERLVMTFLCEGEEGADAPPLRGVW